MKRSSNMTNDEKVKFIIESLCRNKNRDEIARELGYSTYKSMDIFLNRQGYRWNRSLKNYLKEEVSSLKDYRHSLVEGKSNSYNSKAEHIVGLISKGNYDLKVIAKIAKFKDYKEMALFMKSKGYLWSDEVNNYVLKSYQNLKEDSVESCLVEKDKISSADNYNTDNKITDGLEYKRYLPLLEFLEANRKSLCKLFQQQCLSERELPRYIIKGAFVTKSVHMNNLLDQMIREYSEENNISQREIFEIALIEFFKKYGYNREIETLLSSNNT